MGFNQNRLKGWRVGGLVRAFRVVALNFYDAGFVFDSPVQCRCPNGLFDE